MFSIILLSIALTGWPGSAAAATDQAETEPVRPPNIVVVMLDDFPGDVDIRLLERTPAIDGFFLRKGLRFTNAYGNNPLCCPGRANFLTGLYSHHHGVIANDAKLFDPTMTVATQLRAGGYHTIHVGKYMNFYSTLEQLLPPGWDRFAASANGYYTDWWEQGEPVGRRDEYHTDVLTEYAARYLAEAPPEQPVFLSLNPFATHSGGRKSSGRDPRPALRHDGDPRCKGIGVRRTPAYNEEDVSDKPEWVRGRKLITPEDGWPLRKACESLLSADDMFRAVRAELKASGRLRDTIFLLTADNGMDWGDHRWFAKSTPSSTHVPLFIRWPAGLGGRPGEVSSHVSMVDLAPTLLDAAGAPPLGPFPTGQAEADGISVLPTIRSRGEILPARDALLEESPLGSGKIPPWYAIRPTDGAWHYVEYEGGVQELYDLVNDPYELQNLAGDRLHAETMASLSARLAALRMSPGTE